MLNSLGIVALALIPVYLTYRVWQQYSYTKSLEQQQRKPVAREDSGERQAISSWRAACLTAGQAIPMCRTRGHQTG